MPCCDRKDSRFLTHVEVNDSLHEARTCLNCGFLQLAMIVDTTSRCDRCESWCPNEDHSDDRKIGAWTGGDLGDGRGPATVEFFECEYCKTVYGVEQ